GIEGGGTMGDSNAVRCVAMTNGTALIGFTLSGGRTRGSAFTCPGGGVYSLSTDTVISNCFITGCRASTATGAFGYGGGAYMGTLYACVLTNGSALYGGGAYGSVLHFCTVVKNNGGNGAGGLRVSSAYNCLIKGNTGGFIGGGGALDCTLQNCLIVGNSSAYGGGARYGNDSTIRHMYNCTVAGNTSSSAGGGIAPGPKYTNSVVVNSVIYSNTAPQGANYAEGLDISYSCTFPATAGAGNRADPPLFVSGTGDYHLQPASPCINAGTNGTWTADSLDFEGNRRVFGGTADMGCYEYFFRGTLCVFW
ncbi:MAG: choice-of-anchor Q domain-containing protein, partial [Kiritimatiellae bacterium]|nr:choice-of-anchor Q domain-containing protein [Kiritimatiellia bacterium]